MLVQFHLNMFSPSVSQRKQQHDLCNAARNGNMQEADCLSDQLVASGEGVNLKDGVSTSFCAI